MEESLLINDIIKVIKRYFWIILLSIIIGGVVGKMIASSGPAPTYRTSALVLLEKKQEEANVIINQADEIGRFMNTAQTLVETPAVLKAVKSDLNLDESPNELANKIEVTNENNSQILRISIEDSDAKKATKIVNGTAENFSQMVNQYLDVEKSQVVAKAVYGQESQILHTRTNANVAMGVILGLVFGGILAFVLNLLSKKRNNK
jgi:capsular polysaccharide biosynthesis protein